MPIELLRIELVDPEVEVHRQRLHVEDLAQEALDRHLLLALEVIVGVGGVHQQIGQKRQAVGELVLEAHGPAISCRPGPAVKRARPR